MASRRGGHGDEGEPADQGGQADPHGYQEDTFADREDWDRYRADEDVLPGNAPLNSFLARIARGLAAKSRQGRQIGQNVLNFFKAVDKDCTNISREEFLDFKTSLEHSLKEVKAAVEKSAKEQKMFIEASTTANSELMQRALHRLEVLSQDIKAVVDAGVKSQEASTDTAEIRLLNARVGLLENRDFSGSISFNTLPTGSPISFADSSDLDSQSSGSFLHAKSISGGSLISGSDIVELSRRSSRGGSTETSLGGYRKNDFKSKPWLFSLCCKLSTDAVSVTRTHSLAHFLEAERRRTAANCRRNQLRAMMQGRPRPSNLLAS